MIQYPIYWDVAPQTLCSTPGLPVAVRPGKKRRIPTWVGGDGSGGGRIVSRPWAPDSVLRNGPSALSLQHLWGAGGNHYSKLYSKASTLPYLRWLCLCPTGIWLPNTRTEFRKEKAEENDPILERGFPQAHWSLLLGWFWMYHKAMQVLHKPGPKRPGKLRKGEISTHTDLKIKLGWRSAWVEVGAPQGRIPQELKAKNGSTQVPWKSSSFPSFALPWDWISSRGRKCSRRGSGHC